MRHRDRLLAALAHREPDRVPLDLGAGIACGINVYAYSQLKRHLGLDSPTTVTSRFSQLAKVEETVASRLAVDVRPLLLGVPGAGEPSSWERAWERDTDQWGVVWAKPACGQPYEVDSPLRRDDATVADIVGYPWPDPDDPALIAGLRERALRLREETDFGVVLSLSFYPFTLSHLVRGHANWLMDLAGNRPFAEALLDAVTDCLLAMLDRILREVGGLVDVVCWGDDVSIQTGPMIRPRMFRELVKPRYRRVMDAMKRGTPASVFFHTCGSVHWLIPDLIDLGIDILNPVQVSAVDMDTRQLKREFGKDIVFWGGGCDSQGVLPFATPAQVREEVRRRVDDLAPGGGFVFAPVHIIQGDVPPENVIAMYEAALEFGRYA